MCSSYVKDVYNYLRHLRLVHINLTLLQITFVIVIVLVGVSCLGVGTHFQK